MFTPTRISPSISSPVLRTKSASPYKAIRSSPYVINCSDLSYPLHQVHFVSSPPPINTSPLTLGTASSSQAHAHGDKVTVYEHEGSLFQASTNVDLGFSLYKDGEMINPTDEQVRMIMNIFPSSYAFEIADPFLVIRVSKLPPKPWPVKVAGRALWLTTDADASPMNMGRPGHGQNIIIHEAIVRDETPTKSALIKVFEAFNDLGIPITNLQWVGWCLLAFPEADSFGNSRKLYPGKVNNVYIGYIFEKGQVDDKALRRMLPTGRAPDNSKYSSLRPGVVLASATINGQELVTSSGVCVQSPQGKKYITIASHGFPGGVEEVAYHPSTTAQHRQEVGKVVKVFWDTDISLLEPKLGLIYDRETFSTSEYAVKPFRNLKQTFAGPGYPGVRVGDAIHMNTPFNGHCEGSALKLTLRRIPADENSNEVRYLTGTFLYFGNGGDTLFDGCCGAPIWNNDFEVLGQFRFQNKSDDLCYASTFDSMKHLGYSIAEI
ncbi:hypothetical protein MMC11_000320 [Xylographa trunciseda]|nr:hypothetical protein [Xylographa trunciseda]